MMRAVQLTEIGKALKDADVPVPQIGSSEVLIRVAAAGICEIAGFALYTVGAREDIAVTAVLVSLFGAVAALLARFVFRERLTRTQLVGVATIVAGVIALSVSP